MSEVLPKAAAERAKLGFPVPIGHWLTGDSYGFAEQLLRDAQTDEWINRDGGAAACSTGCARASPAWSGGTCGC